MIASWFRRPAYPVARAIEHVPLTSNRRILAAKFKSELARLAEAAPGVLGIAIIDLQENAYYGINERLTFPAASSIKLLIDACLHVQLDAGRLDSTNTVKADFGAGAREWTLEQLARRMIDQSDNLATNILIDQLGMAEINKLARALHCPTLVVRRRMLDEDAGRQGMENLATPIDAARFMALMLARALPLRPERSEQLLQIGFQTYPEGPVRQQLPTAVAVMQMPGGLAGVRNSWAAVDLPGRPFSLAVMGHYGDFETITPFIKRVAGRAFDYFRRLAGANRYGVRTGQPAILPTPSNGAS